MIIYGRKTDNRNGEPYKLVLAVWQNDSSDPGAIWSGSIQRLSGKRPDVTDSPPFRGRKFWLRQSVKLDVNELNETFANHLNVKEKE